MDRFTLFPVVLVFMLSLRFIECNIVIKKFNVMNFGAIGNSNADDTKAFLKAWSAACNGDQPRGVTPQVEVPFGRTFLVKELSFNGPCKSSSIQFQVRGKIVASMSPSAMWGAKSWITFANVKGLKVTGERVGVIDGRGSEWWKKVPSDASRPMALLFFKCDNLVLFGMKHVDSPRNHIKLYACNNVDISDLKIIAPERSPNTDGIDVSNSKYIHIHNSYIGTGDDCIAILNGSQFIDITSIYCGPGHGISIGSLGKHGATDTVEEIHVKNCTFDKTQNGARIKSWQGGSGYAKKISFEDVILIDTNLPINIDQYYCSTRNCQTQAKAVQFSDISFVGFRGTSKSKNAIVLNCSKSVACRNIHVDNIDIAVGKSNQRDTIAESTCINAYGTSGARVKPKVNCLLK